MTLTKAEKERLTPRINQALAEALKLLEVPEKPEPEAEPQADEPEANPKPAE
jgi:hypothetical protein